jgi:hypothetical protein
MFDPISRNSTYLNECLSQVHCAQLLAAVALAVLNRDHQRRTSTVNLHCLLDLLRSYGFKSLEGLARPDTEYEFGILWIWMMRGGRSAYPLDSDSFASAIFAGLHVG